ncbi:protein of unknown function [Duganella sp. CF458]|uniref:YfbM family protein n=1 Tax=Duganella sp. CF458 TaxID=1884368 RepID=UPI0008EDCF9E|nr:YfbM family protein [Duganella sp. CF458]SFG00821.1 protein of unknown function [Duganella sp. CF458]
MSMVGYLIALPESKLAELRADEELVEEFLFPDDGDSEPENSIDLDKAWHGIHYLLTSEVEGGPEPLSLAVIGGEEFGPDIGYGPPRFLTSAQVQAIAEALTPLGRPELAARFDPQDMERKEIYPAIIWTRDGDEALDYVLDNYEVLREHFLDAATRGDAVIQLLA